MPIWSEILAELQKTVPEPWFSTRHSRHLTRDDLSRKGITVVPLENDPALQDQVLSVFHATMHTLSMTPAMKIVENHRGRAFIKHIAVQPAMQLGIAPP